jgi:F0F1-type ATP synthase membrane subunit b/b'
MIEQIILAATEEAVHAVETDPGLLGTLGISWKLFLAQLINFGIVLFVFWKWVVKPLGKTLTDRQTRIESGLKNADLMEKEKHEFDAWRKEQMHKARMEAEGII